MPKQIAVEGSGHFSLDRKYCSMTLMCEVFESVIKLDRHEVHILLDFLQFYDAYSIDALIVFASHSARGTEGVTDCKA